jgi:hypothetical protein
MNIRPLCLQTSRVPRDESLSSLHIPVGNRSNDLGGWMRREIDPHDRASLRDVNMWRRMIQGVDAHLEPLNAKKPLGR